MCTVKLKKYIYLLFILQTRAKLEALIQYKLDQASYEELLHASENFNPETANLERQLHFDSLVNLCIWGNLIKHPKIKSHEFPSVGFTFEIPKVIANSNVAVRVMKTAFDHCSRQTRTFLPRKKIVEGKLCLFSRLLTLNW